jgi:hypothetical protein
LQSLYITLDSQILSTDDVEHLKKWIGKDFKAELLYRATKDGWSSADFHRLCDNKGPTIVVCKSNHDKIFGGLLIYFFNFRCSNFCMECIFKQLLSR